MKTVLPWICVAALLVGGWMLYSANQKQAAELASLQQANEEIPQLREQIAQLRNKSQTPDAEIERLRKDNEDLLRLRNEVRQLHSMTNQLSQSLSKLALNSTQAQERLARASVENQTLREQAQQMQQSQAAAQMPIPPANQANVCINYLRQIESAKRRWAADHDAPDEAIPTPADLAAYFPATQGNLPVCPSGGQYTINAVGVLPTCSIPGHVMR